MTAKIFHNPDALSPPWRVEFYNEHGTHTWTLYFTEDEWQALRAASSSYTEMPEKATDDPIYRINEYNTRREYGGPEEGGWYYTAGEFVKTHSAHSTRREADKDLERMKMNYLPRIRKGLAPRYSVQATYWPVLRVETHPGRDFPETRPHYE